MEQILLWTKFDSPEGTTSFPKEQIEMNILLQVDANFSKCIDRSIDIDRPWCMFWYLLK